jgi:hypothetical protein
MKFKDEGRIPRRAIWIYGYALIPPIARDRMGPMKALLDDGHAKARLATLIWEGRLINGDDVTHILVVSDRPDQDLEVNQRLEAELNRLETSFAITLSVAIGAGSAPGDSGREPPADRMWDA